MRSRRTSAAAALVAVGWCAATGVAAAHDDLVSSTPADGQSVATSPPQVELEFSGDLQDFPGATAVVVTSGGFDGDVVSAGDLSIDGSFARQSLAPDLPDGEYQVVYRVLSSDGHQVEGSTRFFVGPVPPAGAAFGTDEDPASGGRVPGIVIAAVGALALFAVSVMVLRRSRRPGEPS